MAKKLTKSARIRKMLEQGKSVKQIVATLGVSAQMVYQTRSADKKRLLGKQRWEAKAIHTSDTPVLNKAVRRDEIIQEALASIQPKDYPMPKRNVVQRFFNWLCGG